MGILSKSVSLMRHRVVGAIESPFWDRIDDGIRANTFHPVDQGAMVGIGWVSIYDLTDTEFQEHYAAGAYVGLTLRVDTKRVSSRTVAVELKEETRKFMEFTGRNSVAPSQRRELKERVTKRLMDQTPATIQTTDIVWDTANATLYSTATSVKKHELLAAYFKKTFGLDLVPVVPFVAAIESLNSEIEGASVANPLEIMPAGFVDLKATRFV